MDELTAAGCKTKRELLEALLLQAQNDALDLDPLEKAGFVVKSKDRSRLADDNREIVEALGYTSETVRTFKHFGMVCVVVAGTNFLQHMGPEKLQEDLGMTREALIEALWSDARPSDILFDLRKHFSSKELFDAGVRAATPGQSGLRSMTVPLCGGQLCGWPLPPGGATPGSPRREARHAALFTAGRGLQGQRCAPNRSDSRGCLRRCVPAVRLTAQPMRASHPNALRMFMHTSRAGAHAAPSMLALHSLRPVRPNLPPCWPDAINEWAKDDDVEDRASRFRVLFEMATTNQKVAPDASAAERQQVFSFGSECAARHRDGLGSSCRPNELCARGAWQSQLEAGSPTG